MTQASRDHSTEQQSPYSGKWALVAGGSGGIGGAIALRLAEEAWNIAITYNNNREPAVRLAEEIESLGVKSSIHKVDLVDSAAAHTLVEDVASEGLGTVIYAAGPTLELQYLSKIPSEQFSNVLSHDVMSCYNLLTPAIRHLRETRGSVLAVITPALKTYGPKDVMSAAPKAAIEQIVHGIAAEEGRFGIRGNCIGAGVLEGEGMWKRLVETGQYSTKFLEAAKENTALKCFGDVTDIAEAASFLVSHRAKWITGQTLHVDGGYSV